MSMAPCMLIIMLVLMLSEASVQALMQGYLSAAASIERRKAVLAAEVQAEKAEQWLLSEIHVPDLSVIAVPGPVVEAAGYTIIALASAAISDMPDVGSAAGSLPSVASTRTVFRVQASGEGLYAKTMIQLDLVVIPCADSVDGQCVRGIRRLAWREWPVS